MMVMVMGRRDVFPGLVHAGLLARVCYGVGLDMSMRIFSTKV